MASWQARSFNVAIRALLRRRSWGNESQLARRARLLFGTPKPFQRIHTRGIRLTEVDEGSIKGEWLEPPMPAPGAILYVHGGGYISCSPATHRPVTATLARFTRMRVFSLDYRLAPETRFPGALDDVVAAYRWLAEVKSIPVDSLAIGGDSAGGGLTLALLLKARELDLPMPACAVCFSPWTDLAGKGASVVANKASCAMFTPENISDFASAYLGNASPHDPYASPVYADLSGLPPILLHVSSAELLLDDSRRIHDNVQRAGGSSTIEIFDGVSHGWQMLEGLVPEARASLRSAAHFIVEHSRV